MGWLRTLAICVTALAALTVSSSAQNAGQGDGRRVALVIGNAAYAGDNALRNPVRDATAIAESLRKAGFVTVVEATDLDVDSFTRTLREFRRVADGASIGVIYFAGHGMEVNGLNWFVPLSAQINSPESLSLEAIGLEQLLRPLSGVNTKVLILDACRDNPFARSFRPGGATRSNATGGGLAAVKEDAIPEELSGGLFIMYASAPGTTADDGLPTDSNSPFARALVQKLPMRGVDLSFTARGVRDLTLTYTQQRQRPYSTDSLSATPVYLAGAPDAPPPVATPAPVAAGPTTADAQRMYSRARLTASGGDCQALKDFLGIFPNDPTSAAAKRDYDACVVGYLDKLFAENRAPLSDDDINRVAREFSVEPAAIKAMAKVESGPRGGFAEDGRPNILFEPHIFSRRTERRFDVSNPDVSYTRWDASRYPRTQADRWAQLRKAYALDPENAVASASWGRFQIMGFQYSAAGYSSAMEFVAAMSKSELVQLRAVMTWIQQQGLLDELQRLDWLGFARGYHGPGYAANRYDEKLRQAYLAVGGDPTKLPPAPAAPAPSATPATPGQPASPSGNGIVIPQLGEPAPPLAAWLGFGLLALFGAGAALTRRRV